MGGSRQAKYTLLRREAGKCGWPACPEKSTDYYCDVHKAKKRELWSAWYQSGGKEKVAARREARERAKAPKTEPDAAA